MADTLVGNKCPPNVLVTLTTPDSLAPFYRQFGFTPAFAMVREITGNERR